MRFKSESRRSTSSRSFAARVQLQVTFLESRRAPASLSHSLYPAANPRASAGFGGSVATSAQYRVVGAAGSGADSYDGQAFVYDVSTNALLATLNKPSPSPLDDRFGFAVAVSGNYVVVTDAYDRTGAVYAGSAYVFDLSTASPSTPIAILNNPSPADLDLFGTAVAISGRFVVVGAPNDSTGAQNAGSAYVYDLGSAVPSLPIAVLNNPTPGIEEHFGRAVAISGNYVVVGAPNDSHSSSTASAGAVYVYSLASPTPTVPIGTVVSSTPAINDDFGCSVALWANRLVVGDQLNDSGATNSGTVFMFDLTSPMPNVPVQTIFNPAPAIDDRFGNSVAASGQLLAIGSQFDDSGANDSGAAYVFDLGSSNPTTPAVTLQNPSPNAGDEFGVSVALWGNDAVVGSPRDDTGAINAGAAYVYDLSSSTPATPSATLENPTPVTIDVFGFTVAASDNYVLVSAPNDDTSGFNSGSVYVFDLSLATPTAPAFTLANPSSVGWFATAIAVDGQYAVIGSPLSSSGALQSGRAYVYDLQSSTPATPIATLNNPTPAVEDYFGYSVAMSGNYIVVGAANDDTFAMNSGSAYVYDLGSSNPTTPIATFVNPTPAANDEFGNDVAVSGKLVIVGAGGDNTGVSDAGSVYVFDLDSAVPNSPIVTLNNPQPTSGARFGDQIAVSGDTLVIGASGHSVPGSNFSGAAYVYEFSATMTGAPIAILENPEPTTLDNFGNSVAVAGSIIAIGAYQDDAGASDSGSVYLYDLNAIIPAMPIATLINPTPDANDRFGTSVALAGNYCIVGAPEDDTQNIDQGVTHVFTLSPRVTQVRVNDGSAQRSRVTSVTVAFDSNVTFAGSVENAFTLIRTGGKPVSFSATASTINGVTVVTLSNFTGIDAQFGSLVDGRYTLTALAAQISANGQQMSSNYTFGDAQGLFCRYGDVTGDRRVDGADFVAFVSTYSLLPANPAFIAAFDFNSDGRIDGADFGQFVLRYNVPLP